MGGPDSGRYQIVSAGLMAPPPLPIGADHRGGPTDQIVAGGGDNVWTIRGMDNGSYTIALEQTGTSWPSQVRGNNVLVSFTSAPGQWAITSQSNASYTIELPADTRPTLAWTMPPGGVNMVVLDLCDNPNPFQLWRLVPV